MEAWPLLRNQFAFSVPSGRGIGPFLSDSSFPASLAKSKGRPPPCASDTVVQPGRFLLIMLEHPTESSQKLSPCGTTYFVPPIKSFSVPFFKKEQNQPNKKPPPGLTARGRQNYDEFLQGQVTRSTGTYAAAEARYPSKQTLCFRHTLGVISRTLAGAHWYFRQPAPPTQGRGDALKSRGVQLLVQLDHTAQVLVTVPSSRRDKWLRRLCRRQAAFPAGETGEAFAPQADDCEKP